MATLNSNWQELGSAFLYSLSSSTNIYIHIDGKLVSQSTANNTSSIQLRFRNTGAQWRTTNGTASFTGEYTDSESCATYPNYINDGDTIFTISKTISHNSDGNKTFNIGGVLKAYINGAQRTATISQVGVTLPKIDRYATVTSAVDFTDEQNPTIQFSNPGGFRINAKLIFNGNTITRENISNTGTYTFSLTTAERNLLRQSCTGKTMTVREAIATCYSGTTESYTDYKDKTMSIVNANPTYSVAYQDTNATTLAITNNNQQIIQNKSTLQFNFTNIMALKYATLVNIKVTINGSTQTKSNTSSSYNFNYGTVNVANNTNATVVVTDSRGFTTTKTVTLTVLSWKTPSAIITLARQSNFYTATNLTVDANYSSLDSKNTIALKYRIKKKTDTTWGSYTNLSDNVQTTFNADNLYEWDVQVVVTDSLGTTTYNLTLPIGQPILFVDRNIRGVGVNCFPENGKPFKVDGKEIWEFVYPVGSIYISVNSANPSTFFGGTWVAFGTGRTLVGVDTTQTEFDTVEETGGEKTHKLVVSEMPSHNHTLSGANGFAASANYFYKSGSNYATSPGINMGGAYAGNGTVSIANTGGDGYHNNLQPYITVYMWKRTA